MALEVRWVTWFAGGKDNAEAALTEVLTDEVVLEQLTSWQRSTLERLRDGLRRAKPDGPLNTLRPDLTRLEEIPLADDPVNHPAHYTGFSHGAEVIDIVENLPYNRGAAVKYLARAGKKAIADEVEDLRKAQWYVERELARLEGQA